MRWFNLSLLPFHFRRECKVAQTRPSKPLRQKAVELRGYVLSHRRVYVHNTGLRVRHPYREQSLLPFLLAPASLDTDRNQASSEVSIWLTYLQQTTNYWLLLKNLPRKEGCGRSTCTPLNPSRPRHTYVCTQPLAARQHRYSTRTSLCALAVGTLRVSSLSTSA